MFTYPMYISVPCMDSDLVYITVFSLISTYLQFITMPWREAHWLLHVFIVPFHCKLQAIQTKLASWLRHCKVLGYNV